MKENQKDHIWKDQQNVFHVIKIKIFIKLKGNHDFSLLHKVARKINLNYSIKLSLMYIFSKSIFNTNIIINIIRI